MLCFFFLELEGAYTQVTLNGTRPAPLRRLIGPHAAPHLQVTAVRTRVIAERKLEGPDSGTSTDGPQCGVTSACAMRTFGGPSQDPHRPARGTPSPPLAAELERAGAMATCR